MSAGEQVAAAALAAVGARFRLHGREAASGLDCVGLAACALRAGGYDGAVPTGYALRGGDPDVVAAWLDRVLVRVADERVGDLLLMRTGPGQLHLGVWTADGLVHADAGLRRVVVRSGVVEWAVLGRWRVGEAACPSLRRLSNDAVHRWNLGRLRPDRFAVCPPPLEEEGGRF